MRFHLNATGLTGLQFPWKSCEMEIGHSGVCAGISPHPSYVSSLSSGYGLPDDIVIEKRGKGDTFVDCTGADVRISGIKLVQHDAVEGILSKCLDVSRVTVFCYVECVTACFHRSHSPWQDHTGKLCTPVRDHRHHRANVSGVRNEDLGLIWRQGRVVSSPFREEFRLTFCMSK